MRVAWVYGPLKLIVLDATVLLAFYYEPRHTPDTSESGVAPLEHTKPDYREKR